jgi:putative transposase
MDFQFDQTSDLKTVKLLNVIDEFTRECLAIDVGRSITADDVVARLEQLSAERGAPCYLRMDNAWIESFNARLRDEFLNGQQFDSLFEAQVLLSDWRHEYNHERTHSGLRRQTPASFARSWHQENQERLAKLVA